MNIFSGKHFIPAKALLALGVASCVTGLSAQTPTPVPTRYDDWTGAVDSNFLNPANWSNGVVPGGVTTAIRLPGDTSIANKVINYDYSGSTTQRFTFYSIQTGANKTYTLNFRSSGDGWLEVNPIGKGFTFNGIIGSSLGAGRDITNPDSTGATDIRIAFYTTLGRNTRLVLDNSYNSMWRGENGLTSGIFSLTDNAQMDTSQAASAAPFIRANGTAYSTGMRIQLGGLNMAPGTTLYTGTVGMNYNSRISTGEAVEWAGTIESAPNITAEHYLYGAITVNSGTVISPSLFRLRGGSAAEYVVNGRHDGPIRAETGGHALGGTGVINGNVTIQRGGTLTAAMKGTATNRSTGREQQLTINGDLLLQGNLSMDLVAVDAYDYIVVNGNLSIPDPATDSSVNPNLAIGRAETFPLAPGTFTLLTVNGDIVGDFLPDHVSLPKSLSLSSSWRWVGKSLQVSFEQLPFASNPDVRGNQRIVAERLDQISNSGAVPLVLLDTLNRQPSIILFRKVLDQLSPSTYQSWFPSAIVRTNSLVQTIEDSMRQDAAFTREPGSVQTFYEAYRQESKRQGDELAAYSKFGTVASVAGVDYAFTSTLVAGAFIAHESGDFTLDTAGGNSDVNSYTFGLKGRFSVGGFQFNGVAYSGSDEYKSIRTVSATRLGTWATSETTGERRGAAGSVGYTVRLPWLEVSPIAGVQWLDWQVDGFRESGGNGANLRVYSQSERSIQSRLGVRLARSVATKHGYFRPFFHCAWQHEFEHGIRRIAADLFDGRIEVRAPGSDPDGYRLDFGFDWSLTRKLRLDLRYTSERGGAVGTSMGVRSGVNYTF